MSTRTPEALSGGSALPLANEQFKRRSRSVFWASLAGATLIHFVLFAFGPTVAPVEVVAGIPPAAMRALVLLPEIGIPAAPAPIASPAPPVVAPVALAEDVILPPPVAEDGPAVVEIPPPPAPAEAAARDLAEFRHVAPYMMAPELVNRAEVQRALERKYPRALQRAGVEGELLVWFWIDETGAIRQYEIRKSSGRPALDDAAVDVIDIMEFRPALNAGRPVKVIVMLPIRFQLE